MGKLTQAQIVVLKKLDQRVRFERAKFRFTRQQLERMLAALDLPDPDIVDCAGEVHTAELKLATHGYFHTWVWPLVEALAENDSYKLKAISQTMYR